MDLISRESLIIKLDPWYKKIKKIAPNNLAEGFMQVDGLIRHEPSAFDGMTNGEVIKALFPDSYFLNDFPFVGSSMEKIYIDNNKDNKTHIMVQEDWWNAPYQKGGENI